MLSLNSISININKKLLFKDISITFLPSSVIYLNGENGCGKTSLLRVIANIQKPSSGNVTFGKNNIKVEYLQKPYCTYIGHKSAVKPELTIYENLYFWAKIHSSTELLSAAIFYFKLHELMDVKCHELSAGQVQKVSLIRLMACDSQIWLLDEVEANLDNENKELLNNLIISKANSGGIVIASSHNKPIITPSLTINIMDYQ